MSLWPKIWKCLNRWGNVLIPPKMQVVSPNKLLIKNQKLCWLKRKTTELMKWDPNNIHSFVSITLKYIRSVKQNERFNNLSRWTASKTNTTYQLLPISFTKTQFPKMGNWQKPVPATERNITTGTGYYLTLKILKPCRNSTFLFGTFRNLTQTG